MNRLPPALWFFGLLTILCLASLGSMQDSTVAAQEKPVLRDPIEVQPRGPLHEAYVEPFDRKAEPGTVIPKEPPPLVPEEPPEQKPAAESTQWIPGYWSWDPQMQDFMWVSGVYRVPPPDRKFIPGYWQHTDDGWRWVTGFWSNAKQEQLPNAPEPPGTLDQGPGQPAPDQTSTYVPGSWIFRDSRFVWRPGYWSAIQEGRVWIPPHYVWTPNGYLFVDGYWDYPLEARGLAFAPVYFSQPLWNDPSWRYRPGYVVNPDAIFDSAFAGPGGLYFGNYYDPRFARLGYRPWYAGSGRYDPTFAYYDWQKRRANANWAGGVAQLYGNRTNGKVAAPPITLAQHTTLVNARGASNPFVLPIVTPLNQFTSKNSNLVKATPTQIDTQRTFAQGTRSLAQGRSLLGASSTSNQLPSGSRIVQGTARTNLTMTSPRVAAPQAQIVVAAPTYTPRVTTSPVKSSAYHRTATGVNTAQHIQRTTFTTPHVSAPVRTTSHAPAHTGGSARPAGGHKK